MRMSTSHHALFRRMKGTAPATIRSCRPLPSCSLCSPACEVTKYRPRSHHMRSSGVLRCLSSWACARCERCKWISRLSSCLVSVMELVGRPWASSRPTATTVASAATTAVIAVTIPVSSRSATDHPQAPQSPGGLKRWSSRRSVSPHVTDRRVRCPTPYPGSIATATPQPFTVASWPARPPALRVDPAPPGAGHALQTGPYPPGWSQRVAGTSRRLSGPLATLPGVPRIRLPSASPGCCDN